METITPWLSPKKDGYILGVVVCTRRLLEEVSQQSFKLWSKRRRGLSRSTVVTSIQWLLILKEELSLGVEVEHLIIKVNVVTAT